MEHVQRFTFAVDTESTEFAARIVEHMIVLFGISEEEAVGRLNDAWDGNPFSGPMDLRYHEFPRHWAKFVYYPERSTWWKSEVGLQPRPYGKH